MTIFRSPNSSSGVSRVDLRELGHKVRTPAVLRAVVDHDDPAVLLVVHVLLAGDPARRVGVGVDAPRCRGGPVVPRRRRLRVVGHRRAKADVGEPLVGLARPRVGAPGSPVREWIQRSPAIGILADHRIPGVPGVEGGAAVGQGAGIGRTRVGGGT